MQLTVHEETQPNPARLKIYEANPERRLHHMHHEPELDDCPINSTNTLNTKQINQTGWHVFPSASKSASTRHAVGHSCWTTTAWLGSKLVDRIQLLSTPAHLQLPVSDPSSRLGTHTHTHTRAQMHTLTLVLLNHKNAAKRHTNHVAPNLLSPKGCSLLAARIWLCLFVTAHSKHLHSNWH